MNILLISTYELGRQPFGLASPAQFLTAAGHAVTCVDTAVEPLRQPDVESTEFIGFYVPMHTATRLAAELCKEIRAGQPDVPICFYGLYVQMNRAYLKRVGGDYFLGGEYERELTELCDALATGRAPERDSVTSDRRLQFKTPAREGLPSADRYAHLIFPDNRSNLVTTGYTEASRGCKHTCRHCPVVPVYNGKFRIVQAEVVLADIRQQIAAGVGHITFGDPDFLNGPGHVIPIVEQLHHEFPNLTYDVTIKIEHLLDRDELLPKLKETGCLFITSAVESLDDHILTLMEKGHTRDDFLCALRLTREAGLPLNPTFIPFTPWSSLEGYRDLLQTLSDLRLIGHVSPIQLGIRLLIPAGSYLLELNETQEIIADFDDEALTFPWEHPDPRMDDLHRFVTELVEHTDDPGDNRVSIFNQLWERTHALLGVPAADISQADHPDRATIPYLNEPWYC